MCMCQFVGVCITCMKYLGGRGQMRASDAPELEFTGS